jgi:uncharacterized protein YjbJ (UPF0337 family)
MGTQDKAANKVEDVKGKVKETAGKAVGNEHLESEGRWREGEGCRDEAKGHGHWQLGGRLASAIDSPFVHRLARPIPPAPVRARRSVAGDMRDRQPRPSSLVYSCMT